MNIRLANINDTHVIQKLIAQLGFDHSINFIETKVQKLLDSSNDMILVYQENEEVLGLISLHFSVQLAFNGDIMTIGYMVVDEQCRGQQIGKKLEEYATQIAKERKCSIIEVFSQAKRLDAHRFYQRQGYIVTEKFFSKNLEE